MPDDSPWWVGMKRAASEAQAYISSAKSAFRSLPKNPPKSFNVDQPSPDIKDAVTKLCAIMYCLQYHPITAIRLSAIVDLKANWAKRVWPWCSSLFENGVFGQTPTTVDGFDLREKILWLVLGVLSFPDDHPTSPEWRRSWDHFIFTTTPDVYPALIRLWIYTIRFETQTFESGYMGALNHFICNDFDSDSTIFNQVISTIPGSIPSLVKLAGRLGFKIRKQQISHVEFVLHAIALCSMENTLCDSLLANFGIQTLMGILDRLTSFRRLDSLDDVEIESLIAACKWILSICTDCSDQCGTMRVNILLLEGDILGSMVKASPLLNYEHSHPDTSRRILSKTLSFNFAKLIDMVTYLIYPRILTPFLRSFERITRQRDAYSLFLKSASSAQSATAKHESLKKVWSENVSLAAHMKNSWRSYKETESKIFCSNPECPEQNTNVRKQCSRCHLSVYCSRKCQKEDWKYGRHRRICDKSVEVMKKTGFPLDTTDMETDYFRWMVKKRVYTSMPHIQERNEFWLEKGESKTIIIMNFANFPPELVVIPLTTYANCATSPSSPAIDEEDLQFVYELVKDGHAIIFHAMLPKAFQGYVSVIDWVDPDKDSE